MSLVRRVCHCGTELVWDASADPVPLRRLRCEKCGAEHLFSLYEKMDIALSEDCNLKCIMCRRQEDAARLEKEDVLRVFREASAIGMKVVSFCGGEPFMHPAMLDLVEGAVELGLKVQLTTNGTLVTPERIKRLRGLDCMTVSIDAPGALHDKIRGLPGTYEKACRALVLAADEGITRGTNTVIQRDNAESLWDLFEELMEVTEGRLQYVRHAPVEVVPETADLMVTDEQVPLVQEQLRRIAAACDERDVYFSHRKQLLEHLPLYLDKWTRHRPLGGCAIPRKFIGYSHLGFYLCWHQGRSIRANGLVEALESEVAAETLREAAASECVGCNALTYSWDEEWNEGILQGKLVRDEQLPDPQTQIHGQWDAD